MRDLLFIALILACPLAMAWMMSRGHGHGGVGEHAATLRAHDSTELPTNELCRQRDELDRLIAARERGPAAPKAEA